jgi:hypothetical protein
MAKTHVLLLLALASVGLQAQTSVPPTTYTLHAGKLPANYRFWPDRLNAPAIQNALAPDHAFLALLPQADGQWLLKRITSWDTANPAEQTLSLVGALPDRHHIVMPQLMIDAQGKHVIACINVINTRSWGTPRTNSVHAILLSIDLTNFTVVSRSESDGDNFGLPITRHTDSQYDHLAGKDCYRSDLSDEGKYASFDCYVTHSGDLDGFFGFETSQKYKVLSLPDGKLALSISSISRQDGIFFTAKEHDYFLILHHRVNLEVYRLR